MTTDRYGESTGNIVTEDGVASTISSPPEVVSTWLDGKAAFTITWTKARSSCRNESDEWELHVAAASSSPLAWRVLLDRVSGSSVHVFSDDCGLCRLDPVGCVFRVRPLSLQGWNHPGEPSVAHRSKESMPNNKILFWLLCVLLLVLIAVPAVILQKRFMHNQRIDVSSLLQDFGDFRHKLYPAARSAMGKLVQSTSALGLACISHIHENGLWLVQAWKKGVGESIVYERTRGTVDSDDEDECPGSLIEVAMDDYTLRRPQGGSSLSVVQEEEEGNSTDEMGKSGESSATSEAVVVETTEDEEFTRL